MFVYLIVNRINGKYYVGQHKGVSLQKYLCQKISHALRDESKCSHLYNAMRKYPKDAWEIHPIKSDIKTREEVDRWEKYFIGLLSSRHPAIGYNICRGGEGFTGPHSTATRQKIAEASRLMWKRPEIKENFRIKMKGHPVSDNVIAALRAAHLGTKASIETIKKLQNSHIGSIRSEESRKKQSQSITGVKNHFFGKKHSESFRLKQGRSVRCIDTGEMFPTLGHVVERYGGNRSNISRSIRKSQLFLGRRFEYAQ